MRASQLYLSMDPFLRRVGCSLMSDQTLMEMLIEGSDDETKSEYRDSEEVIHLDLTHLPVGMFHLFLQNNQLYREKDFTHLLDGMHGLRLENNQLSRSLVVKRLPQGMNIFNVRGNQFNAIAVVDSKTNATINLKGSGVTSVVAENGKELDMKRFLE